MYVTKCKTTCSRYFILVSFSFQKLKQGQVSFQNFEMNVSQHLAREFLLLLDIQLLEFMFDNFDGLLSSSDFGVLYTERTHAFEECLPSVCN